MKNNQIRTIFFGCAMLVWLVFPVFYILRYESILNQGEVYRFKPVPVDPYDAFRGKYITLSFGNANVGFESWEHSFVRGDEVFVTVIKYGDDGFAYFGQASGDAPDKEGYIKTKVTSAGESTLGFQVPFDRYYLNERLAPLAEKVYRDATWNRSEIEVYLDVRIKDGGAVIEELYFEDMPILEYLEMIQNMEESEEEIPMEGMFEEDLLEEEMLEAIEEGEDLP